ncbi:hypothetical protein J3454_14275 [Erythrobacter sp. NFXS35]|uniref:hypothetical protein n=1 Tax=Erythrobacter sp. NFXS35 TaxID=2818436 RepID=UPI0032DF8BC2
MRFAESAQPGAQFAYGRGERPPAELVQAMRTLVDAGVLCPKSKREGAEFLFLVERGSAPMSAADQRRAARGYTRRQSVRRSSLSMVLQCLTLAAVTGKPCPSNEELAKRCHLSGKDAARYRVGLLVKRGRIAVEDHGPNTPRVVTILTGRHSGKSTKRMV